MSLAADILRQQFADSCARLERTLTGLEDEEFFWEPVAGSWTVHRRSDPRGVTADGPANQETRLTNWGEPWPTYRIFQTLIHEQYHHGAEVSLLRDLYRNRSTLGGVRPG